jgi:hypothetical protein
MRGVEEWWTYQLQGPGGARWSRDDITAYLGISDDTLGDMIREGRFPRGNKPSPQAKPFWSGLDLACWLHLAERLSSEGGSRK